MPTSISGTNGVDNVASGTVAMGDLTFTPLRVQEFTAVVAAGQTNITFPDIPSWAKEISVSLVGFSTTGGSPLILQLATGSPATYITTGYVSYGLNASTASVSGSSQTTGLQVINSVLAAAAYSGVATLVLQGSKNWASSASLGSGNAQGGFGAGSISLGAVLTGLRVTTVNGTDTFDAGSVNILVKG